jgi:hypothetical protein
VSAPRRGPAARAPARAPPLCARAPTHAWRPRPRSGRGAAPGRAPSQSAARPRPAALPRPQVLPLPKAGARVAGAGGGAQAKGGQRRKGARRARGRARARRRRLRRLPCYERSSGPARLHRAHSGSSRAQPARPAAERPPAPRSPLPPTATAPRPRAAPCWPAHPQADGTRNRVLLMRFGVEAYPSIFLLREGKTWQYEEGRSVQQVGGSCWGGSARRGAARRRAAGGRQGADVGGDRLSS